MTTAPSNASPATPVFRRHSLAAGSVRKDAVPGESAAQAGTAFAALFAFDSTTSARLHIQTQTDAAQMFEAKTSDPERQHEIRLEQAHGDSQRDEPVADADPRENVGSAVGQNPAGLPPRSQGTQAKDPAGLRAPSRQPAHTAPRVAVQAATFPMGVARNAPGSQSAKQAPQPTDDPLRAAGGIVSPGPTAPSAMGSAMGPSHRVADVSPARQLGEIVKGMLDGEGARLGDGGRGAPSTGPAAPRDGEPAKSRQPQTLVRGSSAARQEATDTKDPAFDELVKSLRLQLGARQSSARLRLQPPELGHIRVDVKVFGDRVQVDVQTETDQARDLLARRAEQLRSGLESHGIRLERLEVVLNSPSGALAAVDGSSLPMPNTSARSAEGKLRGEHSQDHEEGDTPRRTRTRSGLQAALDARLDVRG